MELNTQISASAAVVAERIAHGLTHGILYCNLRDAVAKIDMHNALCDAIGFDESHKIDETPFSSVIATIREL